jgi:hypothetical protein
MPIPCDFSVTRLTYFSMPLSRLRIATLARLALRTQIRAYERENRKPDRGEARPNGRAFHFLYARNFNNQSGGLGHSGHQRPPRYSSARSTEKEEAPTGGRGFFGSFGGNKVTGGSRHWLVHSTWGVENNPLNNEHFVTVPVRRWPAADCKPPKPPLLHHRDNRPIAPLR